MAAKAKHKRGSSRGRDIPPQGGGEGAFGEKWVGRRKPEGKAIDHISARRSLAAKRPGPVLLQTKTYREALVRIKGLLPDIGRRAQGVTLAAANPLFGRLNLTSEIRKRAPANPMPEIFKNSATEV